MKSLLLLLAALPALAAAEVRLYGTIKSGITAAQTKTPDGRYTRTSVDDLGSHIGLRGSHAIGGGTRAVWDFSSDDTDSRPESMRERFRRKKAEGFSNHRD